MQKIEFAALTVVSLVILQCIALYTGHNGVFLASVTGIIAAVVGAIFGFEIGLKKKTQ